MIAATIRVDDINDATNDLVLKYVDKYDKYLVYYEIADITKKGHYQGIVWVNDEKEYSAMKVRFSSTFPEHKASSKSMAKVKTDNYETYITKDGDLRFNKGYSMDEIEKLASKSYKKGEIKKTKKKVESNFEAAYKYCLDNGATIHSTGNGWEVCDLLQDYYRERIKCEPSDYQLQCMTKSICKQIIYEYSVQHDPEIYKRYKRDRSKQIIGCSWTTPVIPNLKSNVNVKHGDA